MGVGGGAHAGLVGEQSTLGALADGLLQRIAEAAANDGLGLKGILKDHGNGIRDVLGPHHQHHQGPAQENGCHDGDDLLGDRGQALHTAHEDEAADHHQHDAHDPGGHAEGGLESGADGVGLHHAAHEAQGQDDGHGKEAGQEFAEAALERGGDVVHRAAAVGAVRVLLAGLDGQGGLRIDGRHAKEGDDPHPEDGAGAAGQDGARAAHDVAGAHLGGNGGGQGLEGAHPVLLLPAPEGQVAEHLPHPLAEAAHLHKAGADAVKQAHADEQKDQNIAGQIGIDVDYNGVQCRFQRL